MATQLDIFGDDHAKNFCQRCGKPLSNKKSIERGLGHECFKVLTAPPATRYAQARVALSDAITATVAAAKARLRRIRIPRRLKLEP